MTKTIKKLRTAVFIEFKKFKSSRVQAAYGGKFIKLKPKFFNYTCLILNQILNNFHAKRALNKTS